jgi:hypothetical protein
MRAVEASISLNDCVLRQTHLKTRSKLDLVNVRNEKKNPYILKIKRQEEEEEAIKNIQERADAEDDLVNAVSRAYETE